MAEIEASSGANPGADGWEGRLRQVLERLTDAFVVVDRDFNFVYANPIALAMVGRRLDEVVGRNHWELLPQLKGTIVWDEYHRALETGVPTRFEYFSPLRGVWIEARAFPSQEGLAFYLIDVTDRKAAEQRLQRAEATSRAIIGGMRHPVVVLNGEGRILATNRAWDEMHGGLGAEGGDIHTLDAGLDVFDLSGRRVPVEDWPVSQAQRGEAARDHVFRVRLRSDGTERVASYSAVPVDVGGERSFVVSAYELTDLFRTQENLRESEAKYSAVFQQASVGIALSDRDGGFFEVNDRYCEIVGRSREELLGLGMEDVTHPDDAPRSLSLLMRLREAGESFFVEKRYLRPDGTVRWVLNAVSPVRDAGGALSYVQTVSTDVTDRKQAELVLQESERRYRFLAESIPGMVFTALPNGEVDYMNSRWLDYFGCDFFESQRSRWPGIVHPDDFESSQAVYRRGIADGHPIQVEYRLLREDGVYRWHLCRMEPMRNAGEIVKWFGTIMDIQAQKDAHEELERKVAERTADLQAAVEALTGFTYHVSHDLRAPLRAIVSTSRIVQDDYGDRIPAEAARLLGRQAQAANKLGVLIDDLLKLSRLSREEIARARVDVSALAGEAAAEALAGHPGSSARIEVEPGLDAVADSRLLKLALLNLLENAVKYSPSGGTIRVGRREDGAFFVSDEGIGIEPQYLEKIFEPFQRLHRDDEFGGTGIGLANVRQVMERHGGKVWAEPNPERGTTFLFRL